MSRSIPLVSSLLVLSSVVAGCGEESILSLDDRVTFDLFTEIVHPFQGGVDHTQRATVILSPSLSATDLDKITRLRLVHDMGGEWVLDSSQGFVAGERGWELVAERSAGRGFQTGPWTLRMVVEEEGVHEATIVQGVGAIGSASVHRAEVDADGAGEIVWTAPFDRHDWVLHLVRRTAVDEDSFEETVLTETTGSALGGSFAVGFGVPAESFEPPNQLVYRLVMTNAASRRTMEGVLVPTSPPGPSS